MATTRETDELAEKMSSGLRLDPGGQLLDIEEMVYKVTPEELGMMRKQVLQKQSLSGFDDEGLIKRIVQATKPKNSENGAGDNSQSYFNCFQNQIMMPTIVDKQSHLPDDLAEEWLCMVCPEAVRVLVIASHKTTRAYDLEGTWICEHDTHLPGGSPSEVSKVEDNGQCTILDCLYNDENEIYYVVDLLCWKGLSYYKYETTVRMATLREKMKALPSMRLISQSNPFRFYTLPVSENSQKEAVCKAIADANFEITGLLFYHKRALYLPGLSPLGIWVETYVVPDVMEIPAAELEMQQMGRGKQNWRKTRYEMGEEEVGARRPSPTKPMKKQKMKSPIKPEANQTRNSAGPRGAGGKFQSFSNYASNACYPAYGGGQAAGYEGYDMYGYQQGYYDQFQPMPNYNQTAAYQSDYNYLQQQYSRGGGYKQTQYNQRGGYQQQQRNPVEGKKGKNSKKGGDSGVKKLQVTIPVPDDRPNWDYYERHEVMMSVSMEYVPENFETEFLAVICPVAKRRIVVSYLGWTCSYNKLMNMDRKFQSSLPGGNVRSVQVIKSNDMCVLDCLHLKAERTFYILDLMHWKQQPYYQAEADFRFHWIRQIESEMDLTTIHPENEYKFKGMPRIRCNQQALYEALDNTKFKVDGILFFHNTGIYMPGTSPNVLWLPPEDIENVLGWKPPHHIIPTKKQQKGGAYSAAAAAASGTT